MINLMLYLFAFLGMEFTAWFAHKYVMHGFLWKWHKDHHVPDPKKHLQKNDYFFLVFATPGISCIFFGLHFGLPYLAPVGFGIATYGIAYFLIHDVFIHRRIKWFRSTTNTYLKAVTRAHKVHHKNMGKEDNECFGMLWIPVKYIKKWNAQ